MWNVDADLTAYKKTIIGSHKIRTRVYVMDLDHTNAHEVEGVVIDGQVDVDMTADVTRQASLTILDPGHRLHFDADSPAHGAMYADNMIQIWYDVYIPGDGWAETPIFTGPVTSFDRDGVQVTVVAQGKEVLSLDTQWRPVTYKKGSLITDAIRDVLSDKGETRFVIPNRNTRFAKDKTLNTDNTAWEFAKARAQSLGMHLFYDGAGRAVLREGSSGTFDFFDTANAPAWAGGGNILSDPQVSYTLDGLVNCVRVTGATPKYQTEALAAEVVAPAAHPLSPQRLGRNGKLRYVPYIESQDSVSDVKALQSRANQLLATGLDEALDTSFEALVDPRLEGYDRAAIATDNLAFTITLTTFSIPLSASGTMSIGTNQHVGRASKRLLRHAKRRNNLAAIRRAQKRNTNYPISPIQAHLKALRKG